MVKSYLVGFLHAFRHAKIVLPHVGPSLEWMAAF